MRQTSARGRAEECEVSDPVRILSDLGDETRLRVLLAIVAGRKNVSQIVEELGLSQPQVSYHLKKLREAGLAAVERDGRWVWYEPNWDAADRGIRELLELLRRWAGDGPGGVSVERPGPRDEMDEFLL